MLLTLPLWEVLFVQYIMQPSRRCLYSTLRSPYEVFLVGPEFSAADMVMLWYAAQTQLTLYSSYNTAMAGCVLPCSQRSTCSHLPDMQI